MSLYRIAKISYSKVGVTHAGQPRKVSYIPIVSLIHDEKGTIKSKVYLEKMVESKKHYSGWIEGKTYIAGITNEGYDFFDEKGKLTGTITIDFLGQAIQADEDSIICLKGIVISKVSPEGQVLGSRELTVEEQAQWVKQ